MRSSFGRSVLFLFFLAVAALPVQAQIPAPAYPIFGFFPLYPLIEANVRFWEKIYATYTENQAVLHDKDNLDLIYAVVDLAPREAPGSARVNERLLDLARKQWQDILERFAQGGMPQTAEEQRVYFLFKEKNAAAFRAASDNMRTQTGLKRHFLEGVVRSGAYMPVIKMIMRMRGLPAELAYLPHVESSFNPQARSKAGAVGLWQFTKYTGRDFMTIDDVVDERFDFYAASIAAAQFLQENYRQLGSWPLALTAYNYGRAGMVRAKEQWGDYPQILANHQTKIFGFASKNFYAEFLAALRVAQRLENDFFLAKDRPWANASVSLRGYAAAADLCEYFAVSAEEFARLNPALRPPALQGKKYIPAGFLLRLPATKQIRELIRTMPDYLFRSSQIASAVVERPRAAAKKNDKSQTCRVRQGDTVYSLARRFGISAAALQRSNGLGKKAAIKPGQSLVIPAAGEKSARDDRKRQSSKQVPAGKKGRVKTIKTKKAKRKAKR